MHKKKNQRFGYFTKIIVWIGYYVVNCLLTVQSFDPTSY